MNAWIIILIIIIVIVILNIIISHYSYLSSGKIWFISISTIIITVIVLQIQMHFK